MKATKPVRITIKTDGTADSEWEPEVEQTTCCAPHEIALDKGLSARGIQQEPVSRSCKMIEVPKICPMEEYNNG
jgi:hypothetical protein